MTTHIQVTLYRLGELHEEIYTCKYIYTIHTYMYVTTIQENRGQEFERQQEKG